MSSNFNVYWIHELKHKHILNALIDADGIIDDDKKCSVADVILGNTGDLISFLITHYGSHYITDSSSFHLTCPFSATAAAPLSEASVAFFPRDDGGGRMLSGTNAAAALRAALDAEIAVLLPPVPLAMAAVAFCPVPSCPDPSFPDAACSRAGDVSGSLPAWPSARGARCAASVSRNCFCPSRRTWYDLVCGSGNQRNQTDAAGAGGGLGKC